MLRRLLLTTLVIAVVTATLFGVPAVVLSQRYLESGAVDRLTADAQRAAYVAGLSAEEGREIRASRIAGSVRDHVHIVVWQNDVEVLTTGPEVDPDEAIVQEAEGSEEIVVEASESRSRVDGEMALVRLVALGLGLAAVLSAVAVGVWQARRLSGPLVELAERAERLGSGDPRPQEQRYGLPELDRVAEVLDDSAERISSMLATERQLTQEASHQLRTPLTALSMRLEEIQASPDPESVREEAAVALSQVERLSAVVDSLMSQRHGPRTSAGRSRGVVDVDDVVEQQLAEWRPAFESAVRGLEATGEDGLLMAVAPGTLSQILSTLLENALWHGAGRVVVHRRRTRSQSVVVEVSDEGPGVPSDLGGRVFDRQVSGRSSTGLGLALARDLAEGEGGRLELVSMRPAVFAVFLPTITEPGITESGITESGG